MTHDAALQVEVTHAERITTVIVTGEIDADSMHALQASLSELSPQSHILLDMSRVRFMDCRGLRVILTQRIRMTEAGGSIHVHQASRAVRRLMEITGLTDILRTSDTPR
jgi:stage II sporulation protein AA (anti-sigma F factor antagonist)